LLVGCEECDIGASRHKTQSRTKIRIANRHASDNRVGVNRFQFAWLPDRQGSTIDVVCDHIPERGGNRVKAAGTVLEADLALLFMTDRVRHDAESRIALPTPGLIGHLNCAAVMDAQEMNEQGIELGWRSRFELLHLTVGKQTWHGRAFGRRA
jgi:hypothetical protein